MTSAHIFMTSAHIFYDISTYFSLLLNQAVKELGTVTLTWCALL